MHAGLTQRVVRHILTTQHHQLMGGCSRALNFRDPLAQMVQHGGHSDIRQLRVCLEQHDFIRIFYQLRVFHHRVAVHQFQVWHPPLNLVNHGEFHHIHADLALGNAKFPQLGLHQVVSLLHNKGERGDVGKPGHGLTNLGILAAADEEGDVPLVGNQGDIAVSVELPGIDAPEAGGITDRVQLGEHHRPKALLFQLFHDAVNAVFPQPLPIDALFPVDI